MRGCRQNRGHLLPIVRTNVGHVVGHGHRVHGYLRVIMLTHDGRRLRTNRAVTQGGAFGATGYDANMLGHFVVASPLYRLSSKEHLTVELTRRRESTPIHPDRRTSDASG